MANIYTYAFCNVLSRGILDIMSIDAIVLLEIISIEHH